MCSLIVEIIIIFLFLSYNLMVLMLITNDLV